jgi:hypothetical protein
MATPLEGLQAATPENDYPKAGQDRAGYEGPEAGPFRCDHCAYFSAPNACQIVEGSIDGAGCCNLYERMGGTGMEEMAGGLPPDMPALPMRTT